MSVLVVGHYTPEHREAIEGAIGRGGLRTAFAADAAQAHQRLSTPGAPPPRCVFVDGGLADAGDFVRALRSQAALFAVPVFATVNNVADQTFAAAHAYGVDDVVPDRDMGAFTRRAAVLSDFESGHRPPVSQGIALIAHADPVSRQLYGRILRQAGFDTAFASDPAGMLAVATRTPAPRIVVLSDDLSDDLLDLIGDARAGARAPFLPHVVVGDETRMPTKLRTTGHSVDQREAVVALSRLAPPDSLLFVVNELLRREFVREKGQDQRVSVRLLFGTLCSFRAAGEIRSVFGFTYNLSREGLYVKTYDPPPKESELWLELRPPHETIGVHLRGRVMFARKLDPTAAASAPPGFGLRIEGDACPPGDLARYRNAYEQLGAHLPSTPSG